MIAKHVDATCLHKGVAHIIGQEGSRRKKTAVSDGGLHPPDPSGQRLCVINFAVVSDAGVAQQPPEKINIKHVRMVNETLIMLQLLQAMLLLFEQLTPLVRTCG